jgi:hypothetical protein
VYKQAPGFSLWPPCEIRFRVHEEALDCRSAPVSSIPGPYIHCRPPPLLVRQYLGLFFRRHQLHLDPRLVIFAIPLLLAPGPDTYRSPRQDTEVIEYNVSTAIGT